MFNDIEPIPDASTSLQRITDGFNATSSYGFYIVKYKDNYYKVKKTFISGSILGVSKISIDTSTFGLQDIGDGDSVFVTPSTPAYLVHSDGLDAGDYWRDKTPGEGSYGPYYLDGGGNFDYTRPFTEGYVTIDGYDNICNFYDRNGNAIDSAEVGWYGPLRW